MSCLARAAEEESMGPVFLSSCCCETQMLNMTSHAEVRPLTSQRSCCGSDRSRRCAPEVRRRDRPARTSSECGRPAVRLRSSPRGAQPSLAAVPCALRTRHCQVACRTSLTWYMAHGTCHAQDAAATVRRYRSVERYRRVSTRARQCTQHSTRGAPRSLGTGVELCCLVRC